MGKPLRHPSLFSYFFVSSVFASPCAESIFFASCVGEKQNIDSSARAPNDDNGSVILYAG